MPKPPSQKRSLRLPIALLEREKAELARAADIAGQSISELVRSAGLSEARRHIRRGHAGQRNGQYLSPYGDGYAAGQQNAVDTAALMIAAAGDDYDVVCPNHRMGNADCGFCQLAGVVNQRIETRLANAPIAADQRDPELADAIGLLPDLPRSALLRHLANLMRAYSRQRRPAQPH